MNVAYQRRAAALLEVLGVFVAGQLLRSQIEAWVINHKILPPTNPFDLLTTHATNADLLFASQQMLAALLIQYFAYFVIIIPINWWYRRRGAASYGLTRAGLSWKTLFMAGLAMACLCEWPLAVHSLVNAIHPLGATVPWRQAFFDMSWRRWQFWLFAGIFSYALIPVVEELVFRGYYQRRLAEDWGDGPAIVGATCLFTFAHGQYLIANLYNVTMIVVLLLSALGFGVVYARTRSLIPSMIAHSIIDIPMTPPWYAALLVVFIIGIFFARRAGMRTLKQVFAQAKVSACVFLGIVCIAYDIAADRFGGLMWVGTGMVVVALVIEAADRQRSQAPAEAATSVHAAG